MTKYTAMPLAIVPSAVLLVHGLWLAVELRRVPKGVAPRRSGVLVGVAMVLYRAPNWLADLIWYGDPVYPMLHNLLPSRPYVSDTASELTSSLRHEPPRNTHGARHRSRRYGATVTFSFLPNDWFIFHRDVPVFGSLFTLTIPCLPFLRGARVSDLSWIYAMAMVGDLSSGTSSATTIGTCRLRCARMVTATACTLHPHLAPRRLGEVALVPLLALQVIWGGDTPFIATHNQVGDSPLRNTAKFSSRASSRCATASACSSPCRRLARPFKDAVLLTHDTIMILGTDRNWVSDLHQSRISYGLLVNPKAIDDMLKQLGVTHLAWPGASVIGRDTVAGDLAFLNYAVNDTVDQRAAAGYTVAKLPPQPPSDARETTTSRTSAAEGRTPRGLYHLSQLRLPGIDPPPAPAPLAQLARSRRRRRAHRLRRGRPPLPTPMYTRAPTSRWRRPRGESELWVHTHK